MLLLAVMFTLVACEEKKEGIKLPESKGQPSELLVVAPPKMLSGEYLDSLNTVVNSDAPGLGSTERIFRTMTIGSKGYEKIYKLMHSQLFIEIDPAQKEPVMGMVHDVYASPQLQVKIAGNSEKAVVQFLCENRERIQRLFLDFQLDRYAKFLQTK